MNSLGKRKWTVMIWRNLDPKVLADIMARAVGKPFALGRKGVTASRADTGFPVAAEVQRVSRRARSGSRSGTRTSVQVPFPYHHRNHVED
jgi:hypothetical protein